MGYFRPTLGKIAASVCLALLFMGSISLARMLPYSEFRVRVTDALTLPGGALASAYVIVFGEPPNWLVAFAWIAMIGNSLFYFALSYILVSVWCRSKRSDDRNAP